MRLSAEYLLQTRNLYAGNDLWKIERSPRPEISTLRKRTPNVYLLRTLINMTLIEPAIRNRHSSRVHKFRFNSENRGEDSFVFFEFFP